MIKVEYTPNNINFQLASSASWINFYKVREFLLNQLIISENRFSPTCKESFLCTVHQLRYWLVELEERIKRVKHDEDADVRQMSNEEADNFEAYLDNILRIMLHYEEQFDQDFIEIYAKIFRQYKKPITDKIRRTLKQDLENSFNACMVFITQYMQHAMHILYELDYLYHNAKDSDTINFYPFLGLDSVDVNLYRDKRISLIDLRIKVYKEYRLIKEKSYWTVKSYFNQSALDADFHLFKQFNKLVSDIELHDIRLSGVM